MCAVYVKYEHILTTNRSSYEKMKQFVILEGLMMIDCYSLKSPSKFFTFTKLSKGITPLSW